MSSGLLDFFVLEAGEYTEQLDGALARASGNAPDLDVFTRNARALRGSATMARVDGIAQVATGLERLGRGLRDGSLQWSPQLRAAVIAAVDDIKILVRAARTWGPADDQRAAARTADLDALAPAFQRRSVVTPMLAIGSGLWMASETADIAAGLRRWVEQGGGNDALAETVRRVRSLRGIAALADLPPIKDVIDALDDAMKQLELGAAATDAHKYLFRAAADVLRESSEAVQGGKKPVTSSPAVTAFSSAAALLVAGSDDKDYVVPIAALFPDGGGDHVVHAAPNPPTTPAQRFRMEVVSQAEHLRRLVADARSAGAGPGRQKVANELKSAVRGLQRAAESFGETETAHLMQAMVEPATAMDARTLETLDALAGALASGEVTSSAPTPRASVAAAPAPPPPPPTAPPTAPTAATPRSTPSLAPTPYVGTPSVSRATGAIVVPAPTGAALQHALDSGLSGLARLNDEPLAEPQNVEDDGVVPIQDLLYRGKAALARAREVGDGIKAAGLSPDADALAELLDLLELAASD
jgi:HPt (histidine-containing phosphotransfer) domain-containing protein